MYQVSYRPDIDGLRAVAVLSVLFFHAAVPAFSGGFVGVDVFFVISGYLITQVILVEADAGNFSIVSFYERRVRRIFPALFLLLLFCIVISFVLFLPKELELFAQSLNYTVVFSSNILFYFTLGYFDATSSQVNPLLHLWSLAVEEQFYLVYPIMLVLLFNKPKANIAALLIAIAGSFLLNLYWMSTQPAAAFYLPFGRIWEFFFGAVLAFEVFPLLRRRWVREAVSALGLGCIGWSVFTYTPNTPFPGLNALLPCLGAFLLIYSGKGGGSAVTRALSLRPVVFIGLISYSLYLWHWPLIVFAQYYKMGVLAPRDIAAVMALAFAAATLSYVLVERPFRKRGGIATRPVLFAGSAVIMTAIVGLGALEQASNGWPARFVQTAPPKAAGEGGALYNSGTCFLAGGQVFEDWNHDTCLIVSGKRSTALLWGDSFAAHFAPGLSQNSDLLDMNILQYTAVGCPPIFGLETFLNPGCVVFNENARTLIRDDRVSTIVMSARWLLSLNHAPTRQSLQDTIDWVRSQGKQVVIIGSTPGFGFSDPYSYYVKVKSEDAELLPSLRPLNDVIAASLRGATFIDPLPDLCREDVCKIIDNRGNYLYLDGWGHLTAAGSNLLIRHMADRLNKIARHGQQIGRIP